MSSQQLLGITAAVVRDGLESRAMPKLVLTFGFLFGAAAVAFPALHGAMAPETTLDATGLLLALERPVAYLLVASGLLFGVASRPVPPAESGSPGRVASAIVAGRSLVFGLAVVAGLGTATLAVVLIYEDPTVWPLAVAALVFVSIGLAFVWLGVGIGTLASTRTTATIVSLLVLALVVVTDTVLGVGSPILSLEALLRYVLPAPQAAPLDPVRAAGTLGLWGAAGLAALALAVVRTGRGAE